MEEVLESCCCAFECDAQTAKSVWQGMWSVVHPLRFNNLDIVQTSNRSSYHSRPICCVYCGVWRKRLFTRKPRPSHGREAHVVAKGTGREGGRGGAVDRVGVRRAGGDRVGVDAGRPDVARRADRARRPNGSAPFLLEWFAAVANGVREEVPGGRPPGERRPGTEGLGEGGGPCHRTARWPERMSIGRGAACAVRRWL